MRFAKNREHDTSKVAPAMQNDIGGHQSAAPATKTADHLLKATQKHCACHTERFSMVCRHLKMSGSATRTTQNGIATCFETFNKERFSSFPHRHCDGTRKPATRDETCWSINEHFVRDFLTFHTSQLQTRRFPTSFLTNRPQNQRFGRGFRRFSSHGTKCHALHLVSTSHSADNAIRKKHAKRHV